MNVQEVYEFTNKERLAVLSTVTDTGQPQSALLGMAVTQLGNYFRHGEEFAKISQLREGAFPDGPVRESWPGITYFVLQPREPED
jgi:hypothetical protein